MIGKSEANKASATRFIEAFNSSEWDVVREVVHPDFVLHHPVGGTMQLGPEGMIAVWSDLKAAIPDARHPIPIMVTDGDYLATLLPIYGHFDGEPHQGISPTGNWLEYGMVNIVKLENGQLIEGWFGMDPLAEMAQMGAVPNPPTRPLTEFEESNVRLFEDTVDGAYLEYGKITAFGSAVVALGPPQYAEDAKARKLEIYVEQQGEFTLVRSHEFPTIPPYGGALAVDTEQSRAVVSRFFDDVLVKQDLDALIDLASIDVLIHPTAMPCEASCYGIDGMAFWLNHTLASFPDLTIDAYHTVASGDIVAVRWEARGTSHGEFMDVPPTGAEVRFTGISMFRIEDGVIAEIWDTRNTLEIMLQLDPELGGRYSH